MLGKLNQPRILPFLECFLFLSSLMNGFNEVCRRWLPGSLGYAVGAIGRFSAVLNPKRDLTHSHLP